jgi:tripartite ATP-independent transporter DctM subunit
VDQVSSVTGRSQYPDRHIAVRLEAWIAGVTDWVAACLLLILILVLFGTILARYVLHLPVTWTEEVGSLLFLWMGMLGAVSAVSRDQHMRLTFVRSRLKPAARSTVDLIASSVILIFLAKLLVPSIDAIEQNHAFLSPDLSIPGSVGMGAIGVSVFLMFALVLVRTLRMAPWRAATTALIGIVLAIVAMSVFGGGLGSLDNYNLVIFFVVILGVLIVCGVPIGFAFGAATQFYFAFATDLPLVVMVGRMREGMSNLILLTIPLFIYLGLLIQYTGMAKRMIEFIASLLGHVRGGLGYVLLCAMYLVSGISGAKAADMAAIGPILVPSMKARGTRPGDIVALLATSAAAAETIPPSLVLIIIGSVTGVSIAALFTGGLIPAAVSMLALAIVFHLRSRTEVAGDRIVRPGPREIGHLLVLALPGLILPFVIRFAVLEGIATATEVATIGIVYVLIVAIALRERVSLRKLATMLVDTASLSGALLLIIALAGTMSWALTQSGFASDLVHLMTNLPGGRIGFFAASILMFVVLGSVLEGIPAIVLFGPLLFPAAQALGIHQVHYAIVVLLSMGLGLFAPPFGYGYYTACAISEVSPDDAMGNMLPYLAAFAVAIVVIALVPWLTVG